MVWGGWKSGLLVAVGVAERAAAKVERSEVLPALAEAVLTRGTDLAIPVVVRELPAATAGETGTARRTASSRRRARTRTRVVRES